MFSYVMYAPFYLLPTLVGCMCQRSPRHRERHMEGGRLAAAITRMAGGVGPAAEQWEPKQGLELTEEQGHRG